MEICGVDASVLNTQSRTAEKVLSSRLDTGRELTTFHVKTSA